MDDAVDKFQIPNFRFQNDYLLHLKNEIAESLFQSNSLKIFIFL